MENCLCLCLRYDAYNFPALFPSQSLSALNLLIHTPALLLTIVLYSYFFLTSLSRIFLSSREFTCMASTFFISFSKLISSEFRFLLILALIPMITPPIVAFNASQRIKVSVSGRSLCFTHSWRAASIIALSLGSERTLSQNRHLLGGQRGGYLPDWY